MCANNLPDLEGIDPLAILNDLGDAVSIQDTELRVVYQNRRHIELMGDQRGRYCYEAYQKKDAACPGCHLLECFRDGRTHRRETTASHATRRGMLYAEIVSSPLRDSSGRIIAGIESVRDITERRLLAEKLNTITCDLEQKSWRLMAANRELESFSYRLSHDIKNLLARIEVAVDTLSHRSALTTNETDRFLLDSISDASASMNEVIDAILRFSATGQGGLTPEVVDLGLLATELAAEIAGLYPDHAVDFTVDSGLVVRGDRQLLKIMLRNLLGNAWKYTLGVSSARVSLTQEEHDGKKVFAIRDNGIGFDMEESWRLFKPFSRLAGSEDIKGTGIGLATVRRIILCHGGEIWAEGAPGKGATFYFALPL